MRNGSGVSRGDRKRNARLVRLWELAPVTNAIARIDLADAKQMIVATDHGSKVLACRTFRCRAWDLGRAPEWPAAQARVGGFGGVTVACEPTGHRWRLPGQLAGSRAMPLVCVQPILTSWARRREDLTFDKTDEKDAVVIARLAAQSRCYASEPVDETWAGCGIWVPLARTRRLGPARFESAVRRKSSLRGRQRPCITIVRRLFAALTDQAGVIAHRPARWSESRS